MGLNVLLKKISLIEKEILEVWKEAYPSAAYTYGFNDFAGKILIPSKENIARLKKQIKNLRKKTKNKGHLKFLGSYYVDLDFYEPYRVPSTALMRSFIIS